MAIQVLGIAGSPRPIGNSTTLLDEVLSVARDMGLDVAKVNLNDLYYRGCQACLECVEDGRCVQADELQPVLEELRQAQVWVFASPIYFDGVSGQMKMFFDRLYSMATAKEKLPGPRRAAFIITYEAEPTPFYEEVARRMADYVRWFGEFEMVEVLAVSMAGSSESIRNRPEILGRAEALAGRLFAGMRQPAGQIA